MIGIPSFKYRNVSTEVVKYAEEVLVEVTLYEAGRPEAILAIHGDEAAELSATLKTLSELALEAERWIEPATE